MSDWKSVYIQIYIDGELFKVEAPNRPFPPGMSGASGMAWGTVANPFQYEAHWKNYYGEPSYIPCKNYNKKTLEPIPYSRYEKNEENRKKIKEISEAVMAAIDEAKATNE